MSRRGELSPEDRRLWARVSGSAAPHKVRKPLLAATTADPPARPSAGVKPAGAGQPRPPQPVPLAPRPEPAPAHPRARGAPEALEPRRQRRLSRERDPIDARIDLHGYGRFQAQDALTAFLLRAQARGHGAVLVITGQGRRGGSGVIRASVHEWLTAPALRGVVSGYAPAARRHGGEGALYVTLRRG
jgi:DNA-nicking Smr family endonuclease